MKKILFSILLFSCVAGLQAQVKPFMTEERVTLTKQPR